ncbi:LysR family transcriptional regulator [Trinickia mobilis]|uniref:LysR family transcriptional regulator n=1 Tax=Trinickia mobilis TaxID=2816356 RepID=UPI001A8D96DE|nr:LysR family transcriptional regulator [Trinickia mobilis]
MAELLSGVDVFVAAVEAGGFAAAGERLHLTRSAVAKAIARIEERLHVRLLHRTTRSLALTEDGQVYYERCVRALEELRAGEAALESGRREAAGRLRVSATVLFGRHCVAPVLTKLVAQHPKLELELSLSDRPVDLIEDGYDLAIRSGNIGDSAGLMTRTIGIQRMTVCGAPSYLAQHGRPERLDDLPRHTGIVYGRAGHIRTWEFSAGERSTLVEATPPSRLCFDDVEAIADAAEAGHGLAWLQDWLIRDRIRSGKLIPLLENVPSVEFVTHALWPKTPHLPLRVRFAIDALAAALPGATELEPEFLPETNQGQGLVGI